MIPFTICPVKPAIWLRFHPTLWTFDNKHLVCGSGIRYYFDLWSCATTFLKYVCHTTTIFVKLLFKFAVLRCPFHSLFHEFFSDYCANDYNNNSNKRNKCTDDNHMVLPLIKFIPMLITVL